MSNRYDLADLEALFGLITPADRSTILSQTSRNTRFSGAQLGSLMKKYVPLLIRSGGNFGPQTTEHAIGRHIDALTGRQDFNPSNSKSIGYARAKFKVLLAALNVGFVDAVWIEEHLSSCNFHRQIVKNLLSRKYFSVGDFTHAFQTAKSHQMYV